MTPLTEQDYWRAVLDYLAWVRIRPSMYFRSLAELEATLIGHATAFWQLGALPDRSRDFHASFGDWLYREHRVSTAAGWAFAVESMAETEGRDVTELFLELVQAFPMLHSDASSV